MIGNLSLMHLLVVAAVIVLLFGTKRLPELGSGLGKAISNFRKAYRDGQEIDVTPKPPAETQDKDKSAPGAS